LLFYEEPKVRNIGASCRIKLYLEVFLLDKQETYQLDRIYTRNDTENEGMFDDFSVDLREFFGEVVHDHARDEKTSPLDPLLQGEGEHLSGEVMHDIN